MTWFPLPLGVEVGDLPAAPEPVADGTYGLVMTPVEVIPPYTEVIAYHLHATRGALTVSAEDAATRQTLRIVNVAARGTFAVTGKASTTVRNVPQTAAKGTLSVTGQAATLSTP